MFSFEGAHYQLTDSPALPKPAQRPRPPVLLGGAGARRTPRLAARFADEFNLGFRSVQDSAAAFGRVREACEAAGRYPASMTYSVAQMVCCGKDEAEFRRRAAAIGREPDGPAGERPGRHTGGGRRQDRLVRRDRRRAGLPAGP